MNSTSGPYISTVPFILASASPRRRELLASLGLTFSVVVADVVEEAQHNESPADFVRRLAEDKARTVADSHPKRWILGADTVVVLDHTILGKPHDPDEAVTMLTALSGHEHHVWTGCAICRHTPWHSQAFAVCTSVRFTSLSPELIQAYVATGEPLDKAGAYGIQGRGGCLVEKITGSYSNVVGLPLVEVTRELARLGIITAATDFPPDLC